MPSPPRILVPEYPVLITTRVEEGLPFACRQVIELIIWSTLAKAQTIYGVKLCHFIFMANHVHLVLTVQCPDSIAAFMNYLKTETGHAINKLRGRRNRTVWVDGYDAVPILTLDDTIEKIAYIYTNPQKANLVEKIEHYPGVSSWEMYTKNELSKEVPRITRPSIHPSCTVQSLTDESLEKTTQFTLSPDAWMSLFGVQKDSISNVNIRIHKRIRALEAEHSETRQRQNKKVLGAKRLELQPIDVPYSPSKFSRRMWCICKDLELRKSFINSLKALIDSARHVYNLWKKGHTKERYPAGMFPPRFPRLVNRVIASAA